MQGLKFAWIDLTRIISSLGLLEINHHFSKLQLEFAGQHHAGFWWWHLPAARAGVGFVQEFPTLRTANIPNMQQSQLPRHSTGTINPILSLLISVLTEDAVKLH